MHASFLFCTVFVNFSFWILSFLISSIPSWPRYSGDAFIRSVSSINFDFICYIYYTFVNILFFWSFCDFRSFKRSSMLWSFWLYLLSWICKVFSDRHNPFSFSMSCIFGGLLAKSCFSYALLACSIFFDSLAEGCFSIDFGLSVFSVWTGVPLFFFFF